MTEQHISLSQFCDLLALDPNSVRFVTFGPHDSTVSIYTEEPMQTSGKEERENGKAIRRNRRQSRG